MTDKWPNDDQIGVNATKGCGPHPSQNPHMGLGKYGYGLDLNSLLLMKFMHESFELSARSY